MEENNDASSVMPSGFGILRRKEKDPKVTFSHNIMHATVEKSSMRRCMLTYRPTIPNTLSIIFFFFGI